MSRLGPPGAEWRLAPPASTTPLDRQAVPVELLNAVLREHLDDPSVQLANLEIDPVPDAGYSGNQLFRARVDWAGPAGDRGSVHWVLKRWLPGGHGERLLGVDRPLEALAWEAGLLRPDALPPGVAVPILGARRDRDGRAAWIVMDDVSEPLARFSRAAPLDPATAVSRAAPVLDGLARLHVWWEHPERQRRLTACPWLVPMERALWCEAAGFASALGRTVPLGTAPGSEPNEEFRADVAAFLAWLPARERPVFESLLCRREPLVAALRAFPRTLLHGDTDDRNVGLRAPRTGAASAPDETLGPDLILIDWEWIGYGPPALDVARLWATLPAVCDQAQPRPAETFTYDLPDHYFDRYRAYGGVLTDRAAWRRACTLAMLAHSFGQIGFFGAMVRHDVKPVLATISRQFDIIAEAARSLVV